VWLVFDADPLGTRHTCTFPGGQASSLRICSSRACSYQDRRRQGTRSHRSIAIRTMLPEVSGTCFGGVHVRDKCEENELPCSFFFYLTRCRALVLVLLARRSSVLGHTTTTRSFWVWLRWHHTRRSHRRSCCSQRCFLPQKVPTDAHLSCQRPLSVQSPPVL